MTSQFPLAKVTAAELQRLGQALWSWSICAECLVEKPCKAVHCPWPRSTLLGRFFEFYKDLTASYESHVQSGQAPGLKSHEDLFTIIREVKSNPEATRAELLEMLFSDRPARSDQERALNLAVRIVMMVNCSMTRQSSVLLEHGSHQAPWKHDVTFSQFISDIFPKRDHPGLDVIKENLRATKLKKRARLSFQPTDDLRNHLKMDRKAAVVEIFHHTAFLKEQLRLTKDRPDGLSVADSIRIGVLPRDLALETLDSLQKILFPLSEPKSKALLLSLTSTSTCNFDTDILRYDATSIRGPSEKLVPYQYFGTRLGDLYEELTNPTPKGFEKWFERNSSARYVMMATIAGVFFAIFLGILSLGLGAFQAYVGYQAWKHPVSL